MHPIKKLEILCSKRETYRINRENVKEMCIFMRMSFLEVSRTCLYFLPSHINTNDDDDEDENDNVLKQI